MKKSTIVAKNLTWADSIGSQKKAVLENLSFQLLNNELTGLLGQMGLVNRL